ncbi:uncharacterized protein LOC129587553 [Paramacrobiotus metropolitanus]|uniref:uncharacterized protein LOC129587553 n=1 Tax=Paramacrobiotus metropolitanus TaxID=2943436 RepID=UPI002445BB33|nr:uncharacterized protein LOC129587553 [Paramacrobiotus metropolitanus]XP_055337327.1 uncharacterized protein LOC129587553 [Paramacrobiotus metropolitanus]
MLSALVLDECHCVVDVVRSGGLPQRGMVWDVIPGQGVMVDFDYADQNRQLVPFDQCFKPPMRRDTYKFIRGDTVSVLLQRSSDKPWCWYPAVFLAHLTQRTVFVEVNFNGKLKLEVVENCQARKAPTEYQPLTGNALYKHVVRDRTSARRTEADKQFWEKWGTNGLGYEGDKIKYTSTSNQPSPHRHARVLFSIIMRYRKETPSIKKTANTILEVTGGIDLDENQCSITELPVDLLNAVFTHLSVYDQLKCRSVCHTWDVLVASLLSYRLELNVDTCGERLLTIRLHKLLLPATNVLILTGNRTHVSGYLPLRILRKMLQLNGVKVSRIVLVNLLVTIIDVYDYWSGGNFLPLLPLWADVCEKLTVIEVDVMLFSIHQAKSSTVTYRVKRQSINLKRDECVGTVLESWYPGVSKEDLVNTERKLRTEWDNPDHKHRKNMFSMIKVYQSGDEGFASFSGYDSIPDNLPPLSSLRKSTVWFLKTRYLDAGSN